MARSTYISENLTQKQINFMLLLDHYAMDIFSLDEIKSQIGDKTDDINELIENLVHKRILSRIERGKYCRYNFRDANVIGCLLATDGVISYWSALNKYGLTEQFPGSVFVQTTKSKKDKEVFGVSYKFVKVSASKRAEIKEEGSGSHSYEITTMEKTMADCFDLPQYSGGYARLIKAFSKADIDSHKLITACTAIHNIAATKRMGYLAELSLRKQLEHFISFAEKQTNEKYSLFDPSGEDHGEFVSRWKLRLNIPKEHILEIINKPQNGRRTFPGSQKL